MNALYLRAGIDAKPIGDRYLAVGSQLVDFQVVAALLRIPTISPGYTDLISPRIPR
jgi:hypothetical protein